MGSGNETASGLVVGLGDCPGGCHSVSGAVIRVVNNIYYAAADSIIS